MAKRNLSIRRNADGTVTISSGHYRESFEIRSKTPVEKFESVKWAIIGAGFAFSEQTEKMVRKELDYWQ